MKIYLAADHGGFKLKRHLKKYLLKIGIDQEDLGALTYQPNDDYPDYAWSLAKKVVRTKAKGILICRTGVGVCLAANKVKGARAVQVYNTEIARKAREHEDANILCLAADYLTLAAAKKIISVWLKTKFNQAKRHQRRVNQLNQLG